MISASGRLLSTDWSVSQQHHTLPLCRSLLSFRHKGLTHCMYMEKHKAMQSRLLVSRQQQNENEWREGGHSLFSQFRRKQVILWKTS